MVHLSLANEPLSVETPQVLTTVLGNGDSYDLRKINYRIITTPNNTGDKFSCIQGFKSVADIMSVDPQ